MARYIKVYKEAIKRKVYSAKVKRSNKIKGYLGNKIVKNPKIRFKNLCQLTGAARSYYQLFGFSRHCLRKNFSLGLVPGVQKSSW